MGNRGDHRSGKGTAATAFVPAVWYRCTAESHETCGRAGPETFALLSKIHGERDAGPVYNPVRPWDVVRQVIASHRGPRCHCRRGWTAGQSFLEWLCRPMPFNDMPNLQLCKFVRGGVRGRKLCVPPASPAPPLSLALRPSIARDRPPALPSQRWVDISRPQPALPACAVCWEHGT